MEAAGAQPRLIRRYRAGEHATARLLCFPHAGGSATVFSPLSACLPPDIELLAVQYSGRQERRAEPAPTDIPALAGESARAAARFDDLPLALLGHSMGALVAFETARMLDDHAPIARLFASAAHPPSRDWGATSTDASDELIIAELRHLGGVPEPLLRDEDVRREVLRVLRSDYRMMSRYEFPPDARLSAPITVLLGDSDPKNGVDQVHAWERHTAAGLTVEIFPGGHFYLSEQPPAVASLLTRYIRQDLNVASTHQPEEEPRWRLPLPN